MMTVLQNLLKTKVIKFQVDMADVFEHKERTPRLYCMDGTTLSVQAGESNYCSPRDNIGPWTRVEVGFPSKHFPLLDEYKDGGESDSPTESVYGFVPIEIVEKCIEECGGLNIATTILLT
jgi:hypothetical protein